MLKHKYLLFSFLALIILFAYIKNSFAEGCFFDNEAKQIVLDLKENWWTTKEQQNLDIKYLSSHFITKNGNDECIVLIESRNNDLYNPKCHACPANLGVAVYSQSGNKWIKTFEQKNVGKFGQWGKLPEAKTVRIGEDNFGIMFYDAYMHQGHYSEGYTLIARVNGKYKNVIFFITHRDNLGYVSGTDMEPYEWNAQFDFIEGENKQFFDIKVVRKGTKGFSVKRKGMVTTVNEINIYKFDGSKYELNKN